MMASKSIFKVEILAASGVRSIYLFAGPWAADLQLAQLRKEQLPEGIENPLSRAEIESIDAENITFTTVDKQLHLDDTIDTVKRKLVSVLSGSDDEVSFEEMYLFGQREEGMDTASIYQMLTQKGKIPLTRDRLTQYLLNIHDIDLSKLPDKSNYDYNDILSLGLEAHPRLVNVPIGQRFVTPDALYPFTINPFDVVQFDPLLERTATEITSTTNASLLMDSYPLQNNVLYLCTAPSVLAHMEGDGLSTESAAKIYYPFLNEESIHTPEELFARKERLLAKSKKMINPAFKRGTQNINLFYDLWYARDSELDYKERGIKSISFTLNPRYQFNLPLDVVFKLLHASAEVPLIKYNPGKRQEKIYRLYTEQVATNGKKIPFLSKATIFKLMKTIGRMKRVAAYIETEHGGEKTALTCEFDSNASITISTDLPKSATLEECTELIKRSCNPVIEEVSKYLAQSGYTLFTFDSFYSEEVEIIDVEYMSTVTLTQPFNLNKYPGCVSSVFNVIESDPKKGVEMRFKRVSNYDEMGSQEAYTLELLQKGSSESQVVQRLQEAFQLTQEEATAKLAEVVGTLQVIRSANPNRRIRIKNNPGFFTTIQQELYGTDITVTVKGINDIYYMLTIPIYIDSLVRLTQGKLGRSVKPTDVTRLCSKKSSAKEVGVEEIVANAEKEYVEQKQPEVQALTFDDDMEEVDADVLGLLVDDDDDEEDESGDDGDDKVQGGGTDSPTLVKDITGMGLSNPNPFFKRMQTRDPALFLTKQEGKFSAYSRVCPWNARRQPVILTDEEKARIDAEHPGSYQHAVKYGTSPDKQFWYICPRYWSLKDDTSLTQADVDSGEYGGIIPADAKKVPKGKYIFEFVDDKYHKDDGEYVQHYPGFTKDGTHPEGHCLPCCFKQWDSPAQVQRRKECSEEDKKEKGVKPVKKTTKKVEIDIDEYIKGPDKFPLDQNRWGYLPLQVAAFLQMDNKECQLSATNTNLKPNHMCLLRHGVNLTQSQSFIACIADLFAEHTKSQRIPTLEQMRERLADSVDLDRFLQLQNGTLVTEFLPAKSLDKAISNVDLTKYEDTALYKGTDLEDPAQKTALSKAVIAYQRYKVFLEDPKATITYTYLWDLCTIPNPKLFPNGMNLVIINVPDDDITGNVQIVCPTNHYSSQLFDSNKRTAFIMQKGDYMEPIYGVEDTTANFILTRFFSLKNKTLLPNIRLVLETIRDAQNTMCGPMDSVPGAYTFGTAPICSKLIHTLTLHGYTIERIVLNFSSKAIGVIASHTERSGFVPCFPSSPSDGYDLVYMDEDGLWQDYGPTVQFLTDVNKKTKNKVPSRPQLRVAEKGLIVGVLTETNQFVMVTNPAPPTTSGPAVVESNNYLSIDREISDSTDPDLTREESMQKIRLETEFYDAFRNTVRVLLNRYENAGVRNEVERVVSDPAALYLDKLSRVDNLLKQLCNVFVKFGNYTDEEVRDMKTVHTCINSTDDTCDNASFCTKEDGLCILKVPQSNLISNGNNEESYYGRMADELVRYSRIKAFVFEPRAFLSFGQLGYHLRPDEVILLQSLLSADYFEDLVPALTNKYVTNTAYDNAEPLTSAPYSNLYEPKGQEESESNICSHVKRALLSRKWKPQFPTDATGLVFDTAPPSCTFETMTTVIQDKDRSSNVTVPMLKELLAAKYGAIASKRMPELLRAFVAAGKKKIAAAIKQGGVSIEEAILGHDYYLSNLDVVLIAQHYKIPLVMFSSTLIVENKKPIMVVYSEAHKAHYYLKTPGVTVDAPLKYKLIITTKAAQIPTSALSGELKDSVRAAPSSVDMNEILDSFGGQPVPKASRLQIVDDLTHRPKSKKLGKKLKL